MQGFSRGGLSGNYYGLVSSQVAASQLSVPAPAGVFYPDMKSAVEHLSGLVDRPAAIRYWADGVITDVRTGYCRGEGLVHIPDGAAMRTMLDPEWTSVDPYEMTTSGHWRGSDALYRVPADQGWYFERLLVNEGKAFLHNVDLGLCAGVSIYDTPQGPYPVIEVVDFKADFVRKFPRKDHPTTPGFMYVKDKEKFGPALTANVVNIAGHPLVTEIPTALKEKIEGAWNILERKAEAALYYRAKGWPMGSDLEPFTDSMLSPNVLEKVKNDPPATEIPPWTMGPLPHTGLPMITWNDLVPRAPGPPTMPTKLLPHKHAFEGITGVPVHLEPVRYKPAEAK